VATPGYGRNLAAQLGVQRQEVDVKPTAPTLSQHLLAEAARFSFYPRVIGRQWRAGSTPEATKYAAARDLLLKRDVEERERMMPDTWDMDLGDAGLDQHYSRALLGAVPSIVRRTRDLKVMTVGGLIPRQLNVYLQGASRSYILGLWDSTAALARACLEELLEQHVGAYVGQGRRDLANWINEAQRINRLTRSQLAYARIIQDVGNCALHKRSLTEDEARHCLVALRSLLADLYSGSRRASG